MGLIGDINTLINEHGSSSILKERLIQFREELERLQEKHSRLEAEHQRVLSENERLREDLEEKSVPDQFREHRGVLFRRLANGKIQDEAYCSTCKITMTSLGGVMPFLCSKCKRTASFTARDIHKVISEIDG